MLSHALLCDAMRILFFGTYDVTAHPRVGVLAEGLRAHGYEVTECNAPLGLDTASRVAILAQPWRLPVLVGRLASCWLRLARTARRGPRPDVVVVGYLGHFDVRLARLLFRKRTTIVLDHLIGASDTAKDRNLSGGGLKPKLLRAIDAGALKSADIVVVDTDEHLAALPDEHRGRGVVVPVGAPDDWFAAAPADAVAGPESDSQAGSVTPGSVTPGADEPSTKEPSTKEPSTKEPSPSEPGTVAPGTDMPDATVRNVAAATDGAVAETAPLRVAFFGLYTPLQGAPVIGEALAKLGGAAVRATMIGHGQEFDATRAAAEGGCPTEWIEWVDSAELPGLIAAHDVSLGIFGTGQKALRVVPNKVFQGAAAGCAVVTSDTAPQRRALGDGAVYVPPGDAAALAEALTRLAGDRAELAAARRRSHDAVFERFSCSAVVEPLVERLGAGPAARAAGVGS
jgi:glycosyltransferase involved in cell wall biosynthesis